MTQCYKFLRLIDGEIKSENGDCAWTLNEWKSEDEDLILCESGFHCSRRIYQAFSYVQGEILALVEVDGASVVDDDKEAWQKMRPVKFWQWRKEDSVALSIFVAGLVSAESAAAVLASAEWSAASAAVLAAASAEWSAASAAAEAAEAVLAAESAAEARGAIMEKISAWMDERLAVLVAYAPESEVSA